jgi:hypothetical protein
MTPSGYSGYKGLSVQQPCETRLTVSETKRLRQLIIEEEEAKRASILASQRRDRFCLEIEKKHGLTGYSWETKFEGDIAIVVVKGKANVES